MKQTPNDETKLRVLGAGLPRSGTVSFQAALEILSFVPVLHGYNLIDSPSSSKKWQSICQDVVKGKYDPEQGRIRELLKGFGSSVCESSAELFEEVLKEFPEVKVVVTYRPGDEWIASVNATIAPVWQPLQTLKWFWIPKLRQQNMLVTKGYFPLRQFKGAQNAEWKEASDMDARIAKVRAVVPPDQLLIFDVRDGWEPLCKSGGLDERAQQFLDVPVPSVPFPRLNDREALKAFVRSSDKKGLEKWLMFLVALLLAMVGMIKFVL